MQAQTKTNCIIFLIGMPAAGKTYWGEKIARQYDLPFIDLDTFIEQQEHSRIHGLFEKYGEAGFREMEHIYLKQIIQNISQSAIIACGGGTPCFNNNIFFMKNAGTVIYLKASIPLLIQNVKQSTAIRPLLHLNTNLARFLETLLALRSPVFEQAHYILDVKDISLVTFDEIMSLCTNPR